MSSTLILSPSKILLTSCSAADAFKRLYYFKKANQPGISFASICNDLGGVSSGHLSDMMTGRRPIRTKHVQLINYFFSLSGFEAECFSLLVEDSLDPSPAIKRKLVNLRKLMQSSAGEMPDKLGHVKILVFKVFCSMGIIRQKPALQDFLNFFKSEKKAEIEDALQVLMALSYVVKDEEERYSPAENIVFFKDSEDGLTHLNFLKLNIYEAAAQIKNWYSVPQSSFFQSFILSVQKAEFEKSLAEFKKHVYQMQSSLETNQADTLAHFNIQIYPMT